MTIVAGKNIKKIKIEKDNNTKIETLFFRNNFSTDMVTKKYIGGEVVFWSRYFNGQNTKFYNVSDKLTLHVHDDGYKELVECDEFGREIFRLIHNEKSEVKDFSLRYIYLDEWVAEISDRRVYIYSEDHDEWSEKEVGENVLINEELIETMISEMIK